MKYTTMKFKTIIFVVLVMYALFLPYTSAETPYWNTSYSERIPITITTSGTSTPENYQVLLNISYEPEMQPDFDDIRFTNSSNGEIAYWNLSKVDSSYANVWVNLYDVITDPGSDIVWMYYGNDEVSSASVGKDVFPDLFKDFEDDDLSDWTMTGMDVFATSTDQAVSGTKSLKVSVTTSGIGSAYFTLSNLDVNKVIEFDFRHASGGDYPALLMIDDSAPSTTGLRVASLIYSGGAQTFSYSDRSSSWQDIGSSLSNDTWYHLKINADVAADTFDVWWDNSESITVDNAEYYTVSNVNTYLTIWFGKSTSSTTIVYYDNVFIRNFIANEPTLSYGAAQYYTDSLHYNASSPYNYTIESDGTLVSNRTIITTDDTTDTARSTGISYLQINVYDNAADIVRNFTITGDNLDWYQAANLSGSYDLKNSGGIIETRSNGKFTTNLVAGTYWIEESVFSITSIYSITYSDEAYIMWTAEGLSSNIVEYSLYYDMSSSSYSTWDNTTTSPQILLEGLTRDTTYYYEVSSTNRGDTITSATLNFSTQNNTHGFSKYFDRAFVVNDIDGWGVGESMFEAYADSAGEYITWTLILGSVFLVMTIRMESVVVPVVLSLISAAFLFPLLPPEHDIPAKVILGLSITGILWHLFIGRR